MMLTTLILAAAAPAATAVPTPKGDLLAIRVRRAETIANGTYEHAVILVEDGKIVTIGEDLPIERGIPILDLPDTWVVMPGLVNAYTRLGMTSQGYNDSKPGVLASTELWPGTSYEAALENGVTTLGQYPAGNGIPGQAVAVQPIGATKAEMTLADNVYLKIILRATGSSKKMIKDGFKEADKFLEKERKNREKWEKAQEKKKKKKKKSSSKKDKDKDDEKKDDEEKGDEEKGDDDEKKDDEKKKGDDEKKAEDDDEYVPLVPDAEAQAFLDLRAKTLRALVSISSAAQYEHLLDAIGDEEFDWDLRVGLTRNSDIFHVKDKIGASGRRVVVEPTLTLHPGTMRQRNLPAEFARAGAKLVLIPRSDSSTAYGSWLRNVGEIVAAGLDRDVALRALTQEPADLLGLGERFGSLEAGKDANLIFLNGDPFEPGTKVEAVMIGGKFEYGEVNL